MKDQNIRKKPNIKKLEISKIIGTVFAYLKNIIFLEKTFPSPNTRKLKILFRVSRLSLDERLGEWKLVRMRRKALRAENTENGSLYKTLFRKLSFSKIRSLVSVSKRRKLAIGFITAMVMIAGVFLYFQTRVGATTYQWLQASWTGGADTVNFPNHINNQSGWTKFFSKDTTQVKTDSGDIEINSTSSSYTETDNASGFSDALSAKSNTYTSGTGVLLKKNNGVSCTTAQTTDYECTAGNCDGDFSSGNYCHATVSSCVNYALGTPWERANEYEQCSGDSYYKSCSNSVWGAQQNCDTNNAYCDAGGGAQSGWRTGQTCSSGIGLGCQTPSCTSCSPYIAASTSSCKTTCASGSDCWSGYACCGGACIASSFSFNGLTYGIVSANSKCWLDRNLGATKVATAFNDCVSYPTNCSYGDLYQWGRLTDGHQIRTSVKTTTLATGDVPGHANFIYTGNVSPYDWRNPQNDGLSTIWGGVNGTSSPCPTGWRVPTQAEWASVVSALGITNYNTAWSSLLKLTAGGVRQYSDGSVVIVGSYGYYWSSTFSGSSAYFLSFSSDSVSYGTITGRANGSSIRCVKD